MNGDEIAENTPKDIIKILVTGELDIETNYKFEKIIYKPYKISEMKELINKYLNIS